MRKAEQEDEQGRQKGLPCWKLQGTSTAQFLIQGDFNLSSFFRFTTSSPNVFQSFKFFFSINFFILILEINYTMESLKGRRLGVGRRDLGLYNEIFLCWIRSFLIPHHHRIPWFQCLRWRAPTAAIHFAIAIARVSVYLLYFNAKMTTKRAYKLRILYVFLLL